MKKKKSFKYLIGLFIAIILPIGLYFLMKNFSDQGGKVKMPEHYRIENIYSKTVNGKEIQDTVYHRVKDLELKNQLGNTVSLNKDLEGKILVIDFIFTHCTTICPLLTKNMSELVDIAFARRMVKNYSYPTSEKVQFISITVDPWRDSVEVLRNYADKFNADHDRWWFLTGSPEAIFDYARNELGLTLQESDAAKGMYDHSDKFVLLDTQRQIRGYFKGDDDNELRALADAVILLTMEKKNKDKEL